MANAKINLKNFKTQFPKALSDDIDEKFIRAKRSWENKAINVGKKLIDETIGKGISPVKGGGNQTGKGQRFTDYSESYKKRIRRKVFPGKKLRPINLKLTGKMRRSIKGRPTKEGILIFYSDKKASYHTDLGAGKGKVIRRMLPGKGTKEVLSRTITQPLLDLFIKLFK